jgi:chromosome partitioning protein
MKVVSLISQKGGSGKSTLAAHYAVEAARGTLQPVYLVDLDPQRSLTQWCRSRSQETPVLVEAGREPLAHALEACHAAGARLVFIDTAPHILDTAHAAASLSDLVIIPTRASIFDLRAVAQTVEIVRRVNKPAVLVINAVRPRATRLFEEARRALKPYGLPLCPTGIGDRAALQDALFDGCAVREIEPYGSAAGEILKSWNWIRRRIP